MLLRQSRCSAGPCDQSHVAQLTASCSPLALSPAAFFFTSCSTVTANPRFWKQSHRPVSSPVSTQRLTRDETARVSTLCLCQSPGWRTSHNSAEPFLQRNRSPELPAGARLSVLQGLRFHESP